MYKNILYTVKSEQKVVGLTAQEVAPLIPEDICIGRTEDGDIF